MLHTTKASPGESVSPQEAKILEIERQQASERARAPSPHEPQRIRLDRIIVAPKLSKLEYDMERLCLGEEAVIRRYMLEGAPFERIIESHYAQKQALSHLRKVFAPEQFLSRRALTSESVREADLVIAFGGDNHFQYVSHAIRDGFIIGVNSDPQRSEGALVPHRSDDLMSLLDAFARGEFLVEEWTRLEGEIDGKALPLVVCEYFLGEQGRLDMSRYTIQHGEYAEEQKSSGLIVSTGAGSTGWYDSEISDYRAGPDIFARTRREARIFVTAPFRGRLTQPRLRHALLLPGEQLAIASLNDSQGVVGCDALERIPFARGALARIRISDHPLKVLRIQ